MDRSFFSDNYFNWRLFLMTDAAIGDWDVSVVELMRQKSHDRGYAVRTGVSTVAILVRPFSDVALGASGLCSLA